MGRVIKKLSLKRKKNRLYWVKGDKVQSMQIRSASGKRMKGKRKTEMKISGFKPKQGHLYYLKGKSAMSLGQAKMKSRGRKKK